jgi:hypothetical protein
MCAASDGCELLQECGAAGAVGHFVSPLSSHPRYASDAQLYFAFSEKAIPNRKHILNRLNPFCLIGGNAAYYIGEIRDIRFINKKQFTIGKILP